MMGQLLLANSIFKMEVRSILAYRVSFWINFLGTCLGHLGLSYFLWSAIYQGTVGKIIGGMNFQMMILYSFLAPMTIKTIMGLQMLDISQDIYTGGLNKFIIYPVHYFQVKWIQQMTHTLSRLTQLLITFLLYLIVIKMPDGFHIKAINVFLFFINVLISSTLFFVMEALMELTAFWAENVWSLSVLLRFLLNFFGGAWLSLSLFPDWSQHMLTLLPFRGMIYTPVKLLMGEIGFSEWLQVQLISMTWILIITLVVVLVWRKGRLIYTGVGI